MGGSQDARRKQARVWGGGEHKVGETESLSWRGVGRKAGEQAAGLPAEWWEAADRRVREGPTKRRKLRREGAAAEALSRRLAEG